MPGRSSNHVKHATALVQKAEKEASMCDAAVNGLHVDVLKMEEALERAQEKAQAASAFPLLNYTGYHCTYLQQSVRCCCALLNRPRRL